MIEWIVIFLIIFCILVAHYTQSVAQYSLSQINESQISTQLATVWEEKKPVVVSDVRSNAIWVPDGLKQTRFWGAQPIWESYQQNTDQILPQSKSQQLTWSEMLGVSQIESDILLKWFSLSPWLFSVRTEAHIGSEGLRQCYGWATAYTCSSGELRCIMMHSAQKNRLPPGWKNLRWSEATVAHHPLWTQVQYIEVILRPGTVLLVPPHWIVAIEPMDEKPIWWTRSDIHHIISRWAQRLNEKD